MSRLPPISTRWEFIPVWLACLFFQKRLPAGEKPSRTRRLNLADGKRPHNPLLFSPTLKVCMGVQFRSFRSPPAGETPFILVLPSRSRGERKPPADPFDRRRRQRTRSTSQQVRSAASHACAGRARPLTRSVALPFRLLRRVPRASLLLLTRVSAFASSLCRSTRPITISTSSSARTPAAPAQA